MMNQHCGKNRHLEPHYFSMEMYLRFNLGPLHLLDGLINEVLASDNSKNYIRGEKLASRTKSKDLNKSSGLTTCEENQEFKSRFPTSFWL